MKIEKKHLQELQYTYTAYPPILRESLHRIGLNFPIYVRMQEDGYLCTDGQKRLSAISDILKDDPAFAKFQFINVVVIDYARSEVPYHMHNHH